VRVPPPPPLSRSHAWFDRARALPSCIGAFSMRSQAEIDAHTPSGSNRYYRYLKNDTYPEAIDACKYTLPVYARDGVTPVKNQEGNQKVELVLNWSQPGAILLVAWEVLWTEAWRYAFTPQPGDDWAGYKFKTFQLTSPIDRIYFESRNLWGRVRGPQYVSVADIRTYGLGDIDAMAESTLTGEAARNNAAAEMLGVSGTIGFFPAGERAVPNYGADTGMLGGVDVRVSTLYRYIKEVRYGVPHTAFDESWNPWRRSISGQPILRADGTPSSKTWPVWNGPVPPGTYSMISEYMVPEDGDPICVLDRVPAVFRRKADGSPAGIGKMYSEMNTSAEGIVRHGDAIAYLRNMVAFRVDRGLAIDPTPLQERPVR
jgi:hypothetical protein